MKKLISFLLSLSIIISSCRKEEVLEPAEYQKVTKYINTIPEFYLPDQNEEDYGKNIPTFTVIANNTDQVSTPQDLDFHPSENRTFELWVLNRGTENAPTFGGSTVTIYNAGKPDQSSEYRQDGNAWHFMSLPSAIAFGDVTYQNEYTFATSAGVFDANHTNSGFTGPTLWTSDMSVYAIHGNPPTENDNGSHLDMLHASPYSMGIAHEKDNIYWVFDGYNGHIVKYDFVEDHSPGQHYHGDGKVHRYTEVEVVREPDIPSHLVLDEKTGWLYICETSKGRILRLDINSGNKKQDLMEINEPLEEHWEMENVNWEIFASNNLQKPCGIDLVDNRLFVSDNATNEIIAYDVNSGEELGRITTSAASIMGINVGPDGKLWYVDFAMNEVVRVDPN